MSGVVWFSDEESEAALTGSEAIAFVGAHWVRWPKSRILEWCQAGRLDAWGYFTAIEHGRGGRSNEWSSPFRVIPTRFLEAYALDRSFETFDPEVAVIGDLGSGNISISFGDPVERVQRVTDITCRLADLEALLKDALKETGKGKQTAAVDAARKRGRPKKWDWEAALAHVAAVLSRDPDGLPEGRGAQAKIERVIADWFVETAGEAPSEGEVRNRARLVFDSASALEAKGRKIAA
jgi:hypothetical protein